MEADQLFNIVAINDLTGKQTLCFLSPMTHRECCIVLSKFTPYRTRTLRIVYAESKK